MTDDRRYRFVVTLAARTNELAQLAERVLRCHPGTLAVQTLGHGGLNWIVCAAPDGDLVAMMTPQTAALMAHVQPVIAGLAEAHVVQAANWHSCRELNGDGGFVGGELALWW